MELYGRRAARNGSKQNHDAEWAPVTTETGLEESMSSMGLWGRDAFPERSGVPDCAYYIRNGSCGYGANCRYNHPLDRGSAGGAVSMGGAGYPERIGEPECQYYLRTGTCKFGTTCKFHHPRNAVGSFINVPLNSYGYPLRLGEKECSYYLKMGRCKFGITCKFHHPQPVGISVPATARPFYPTVQSLSAPSPEQYGCTVASSSYRVQRPPLLTSSYVPGAYGPVLLHTGMLPIPNWNPYTGAINPAFSPRTQAYVDANPFHGGSQLTPSAPATAGSYPLPSTSSPSGSNQKEHRLPERPGEPECQYYMKNGDCRFGSSCRYHHPPGWVVTKTYCLLSPLGLPLRPGVESCGFYLQKGHCKFGRNCKFDHPMGTLHYSPSASSLTDRSVAPYMLGSSANAMVPTVSYAELQAELVSGSKLDSHMTRDQAYGNSLSNSVGLMLSGTGPFFLASAHNLQISSQNSNTSVGRSIREVSEVRHPS